MKHMFHLTCYFELMLFQPSSELNYSERHGRVTFRCKKLIDLVSARHIQFFSKILLAQLTLVSLSTRFPATFHPERNNH